jgi:phosphoglycerol transferase
LLYAGTAVFALLVICAVVDVWDRDLGEPLAYKGDALHVAMQVEGIRRHGSSMRFPELGAPSTSVQLDYPTFTWLIYTTLGVMAKVLGNTWLAINLFYLLTYPLIAISSLFVMRRLGVAVAPAVFCSLLYAFLFYHFYRNVGHLKLGAYFLVPLVVLVILWLFRPGAIFFRAADESEGRGERRTGHIVAALLICFAFVSSHVYYSFFACFFLLLAGLLACWSRATWRPLASAMVLVLFFAVVAWIGLHSSRAYWATHSTNPEVATRIPMEAEVGGLKLTHLLLPSQHHRVDWLAAQRARYDSWFGSNETAAANLGLFGSVGFALLLLLLLRYAVAPAATPPAAAPPGRALFTEQQAGLLRNLAALNLGALLLGSVGAFGSIVALWITPLIRGYNRISIFIAFFALLALAVLIDALVKRYVRSTRGQVLTYGALCGCLVLGLFDQVPVSVNWGKDERSERFQQERQFVQEIERRVPAGAMILQLPFHGFPEAGPRQQMVDYEHLKGYFHSRHLRWSYGAMTGRGAYWWQDALMKEPMARRLDRLVLAGFRGIWINRDAYPDRGASVSEPYRKALAVEPLVSADDRLEFFSLVDRASALREQLAAEGWQREMHRALPVIFYRGAGFYAPELDGGQARMWSRARAEVVFENMTSEPKKLIFKVAVQTLPGKEVVLKLESDMLSKTLTVSAEPKTVQWELEVPAGTHLLRFYASDEFPGPEGDDRRLSIRYADMTVERLD